MLFSEIHFHGPVSHTQVATEKSIQHNISTVDHHHAIHRMTNREALEAFARNEQLDRLTIRRLLSAGLIEAEDVTNFDTPYGQREFLPVSVTLKGQRLLDGKPNINDSKHSSARTRWKQLARIL